MDLLNAIVSYKDCFYYIDKLYKTNGVYDGVVRIRSIEDESITIRIMFKALTKVSNWGGLKQWLNIYCMVLYLC